MLPRSRNEVARPHGAGADEVEESTSLETFSGEILARSERGGEEYFLGFQSQTTC